jgi:hypothetical protein
MMDDQRDTPRRTYRWDIFLLILLLGICIFGVVIMIGPRSTGCIFCAMHGAPSATPTPLVTPTP